MKVSGGTERWGYHDVNKALSSLFFDKMRALRLRLNCFFGEKPIIWLEQIKQGEDRKVETNAKS